MPEDPRNPGGDGGGFSLSQKYIGLPAWAWLGLAFGAGLIWFYARKSKTSDAAPPVTNTVTVPGADSQDVAGQLATINAQIRDLQGAGSTAGSGTGSSAAPSYMLPPPGVSSGPHNTGPLPSGASLEGLASTYWGDPTLSSWLYWVNQDLIENAAKRAGHPDSNGGKILVPGINLDVPAPLQKAGGAPAT